MKEARRRRGRGAARATLCVGLAASLAGCGSWRAADADPALVIASERPSRVRVTTRDGDRSVLERPRVLGGVLAGVDAACAERFGVDADECPETGVPVFEVSAIEVYERGLAQIVLPAIAGLTAAWLLANR